MTQQHKHLIVRADIGWCPQEEASYKISELENLFSMTIKVAKEEEIDTVGGLVFYIANKVPKTNEIFFFDKKIQFKILNADERKIITLEIKKNI